jgi:CheY-like chemotaxis protein
LFTPFEQFHRGAVGATGTGLGLSITRSLVELLHGTINVTSAVGEGTVFEVMLPFKLPASSPRLPGLIERACIGIADSLKDAGPVLLIDDDAHALKYMARILKSAGVACKTAQDRQAALRLARGGAPAFKLAILDSGMRDIIEGLGGDIRVLVTAPGAAERELEAAGIADILEKPFVVSTFLQKVCSSAPEIGAGSAPTEKHASFPEARVLLVEDNEINRIVAMGLLESFDILPDVACDGREALDMLERKPYDLVLMDMFMPVMDGHEATRAIREGGRPYRDVPIVAMTANVMPDDIARYRAEGMDGHIGKPIELDEVERVLRRTLSPQLHGSPSSGG